MGVGRGWFVTHRGHRMISNIRQPLFPSLQRGGIRGKRFVCLPWAMMMVRFFWIFNQYRATLADGEIGGGLGEFTP
ncbi:MAG TPA: hypothetical protein DCS88_06690 [Alphaproteobacteria bacterium]|nr:hypothetical protein [Alphaproteobacteria bacterium]